MSKNKVYTLLRTSATRGEQAQDVRVFGKLADAKKQMQDEYLAELNDWENWCDEDMLVTEEYTDNELDCCIFELGYYNENHIDWKIEEKTIQ